MLFLELLNCMSEKCPVDIISNSYDREIFAVEFLDRTQSFYMDTTLYIGFGEQVTKAQYPRQCVLAGDMREGVSLPDETNLALTDRDGLFLIANEATRRVRESEGKDLYQEMLDIGDRFETLDNGMNTAAARMGNPLLLLDMDMSVLACSDIFSVKDGFWEENIRHGYCGYAFRRYVMKLDELRSTPSEQPFIVSCAASSHRMLFCRILIDGRCAAFGVMLEQETSITPIHMERFPRINRAVGEILKRYAPYLVTPEGVYGKLLFDMLTGVPGEELTARTAELRFPANMCALYVSQGRIRPRKKLHLEVSTGLKELIPGVRMTFYDEGIAALLPLDGDISLPQWQEKLSGLAENENVSIGMSDRFFDIADFTRGYAQAHRAIEMSAEHGAEGRVHRYGRYAFFDLLDAVGNAQTEDMFRHPALEILRRYDASNATEYYRTLKTYLACDRSIKDAAQALFIHRNTMVYRLERLKDLTNTDLGDADIRFRLEASFRIDEYRK